MMLITSALVVPACASAITLRSTISERARQWLTLMPYFLSNGSISWLAYSVGKVV